MANKHLQILIAAMNQSDFSLIEKMNIYSDCIMANQTDNASEGSFDYGPYKVEIFNSTLVGISANRNLALSKSTADIVLFADDDIVYNAKTQRIGVCNACESLLVHEKVADSFLPVLKETLAAKNVELRGDERARSVIPMTAATEEDWGTEYLDYILSVKTVKNIEEAIAHINRYNTGHSETIVTENEAHAEKFLKEVDAAAVYVNVSTRFTDGFEFGFGAEIGISTQKLHARGPMGLEALTSYKYNILGNGQVRG